LSGEATHPISTRGIAEKAGVGVGSLYEYFPGKEAILARLVELDLKRNEERLRAFVDSLHGADARSKIHAIVNFGVDQFLSGSGVKRRLFQHIYRLRKVRDVLAAWEGMAEIFSKLMREHIAEIRISEERIDFAAYMMSHGIQGLLQAYLFSEEKRYP